MERFVIFTRTWWRENEGWPGGLEPHFGKKRTIGHADSEDEAREIAQAWNAEHEPGRLSLKAEFTEA